MPRTPGKRVAPSDSNAPNKRALTSATTSIVEGEPPVTPWPAYKASKNAKVRAAYTRLSSLGVQSTRFYAHDLLKHLGVDTILADIFDQAGWGTFFRANPITYTKPTLEFLSTYTVDDSARGVSFRLRGHTYTKSYAELATLCGLPVHEGIAPLDHASDCYDSLHFWNVINERYPFNKNGLKASWMVHPIPRLIHRFLSCAFFAKDEFGAVPLQELFVLWALMVGPSVVRLDAGAWIAAQLFKASTSTKKPIHIGGVVTLIAQALDIVCAEPNDEASGSRTLSFDTLRTMNVLSRVNKTDTYYYQWLVGHPPVKRGTLPNVDKTRLPSPSIYLRPEGDPSRVGASSPPAHSDSADPLETESDEDSVPSSGTHRLDAMARDIQSIRTDLTSLSSTVAQILTSVNTNNELLVTLTKNLVTPHPPPDTTVATVILARPTAELSPISPVPTPADLDMASASGGCA